VESRNALLEAKQGPTRIEQYGSYQLRNFPDYLLGLADHQAPTLMASLKQKGPFSKFPVGGVRSFSRRYLPDMKWISEWRFAIPGVREGIMRGIGFASVSLLHIIRFSQLIDSFKRLWSTITARFSLFLVA